MKTSPGTLSGILCIVAVVGAGIWHAHDPDMQRWPLSTFASCRATTNPSSEFSVNHIDWSADGRVLLSLSRGGLDAESHLALYDTQQKTFWMPFDVTGDS